MTIDQANAINKKFRDMESTIKTQMDTITKYEQKVVFVETVNTHKADSLSRLVDKLKIKADSLQLEARKQQLKTTQDPFGKLVIMQERE